MLKKKEPKKKLDQINHLGSKLTKLPHSLALLQSKKAFKKSELGPNLPQFYYTKPTTLQQIKYHQHTPNTTKHTESFTMERERERSPHKFIPSAAYGKNSVYSI